MKVSRWLQGFGPRLFALIDLQDTARARFEIADPTKRLIWLDIIREGRWKHDVYGIVNITKKLLGEAVANFTANVLGSEPPVDYRHNMFKSGTSNDDAKAAGWIKSLEIRAKDGLDHLWGLAELTEEAWDRVQKKEYRYISAVLDEDHVDRSGKNVGAVLEGCALTNRPFIPDLEPIILDREEITKLESPKTGGTVNELIELIKTKGLTYAAIRKALEDAKIGSPREAAAWIWLSSQNKIPAGAAELRLAVNEIQAFDPDWATEIKGKGQSEVTIQAIGDDVITASASAIGKIEVQTPEPEKKPDAEKKPDEIVAERDAEIKTLRAALEKRDLEEEDAMIAKFEAPTREGRRIAPIVVSRIREIRKLSRGLEPGKKFVLSQDEKKREFTDASRAILSILMEAHEAGTLYVLEGQKTKSSSQKPEDESKKTFFEDLLPFGDPTGIPEDELQKIADFSGVALEAVDRESALLDLLAKAIQKKDSKAGTVTSYSKAYDRAKEIFAKEKAERKF